jgi:hypothetical protein
MYRDLRIPFFLPMHLPWTKTKHTPAGGHLNQLPVGGSLDGHNHPRAPIHHRQRVDGFAVAPAASRPRNDDTLDHRAVPQQGADIPATVGEAAALEDADDIGVDAVGGLAVEAGGRPPSVMVRRRLG